MKQWPKRQKHMTSISEKKHCLFPSRKEKVWKPSISTVIRRESELNEFRMINLRDLSLEETERLVVELEQPALRAKQIFQWIGKGKKDFRETTKLPEVFKEKLSEKCRIGGVETAAVQ